VEKMHTVKEDTTLIGVSELRTRIDKILKEAKFHKIVIEKRNKPLAVLIAIDEYNAMEELLDRIEDYELARMAKERDGGSSRKNYISMEEAFKKAGR
jgi:prevent-host-death family protein